MNDRISLIERIINLRALGEGNSSEAEAFAAFRKAEKMMEAYNIEEAELAMAEASGEVKLDIVNDTQDGVTKNGNNRSKAILAYSGLMKFCEVKVCFSGRYTTVNYTGHKPDVEMAKYIAEVIYNSLEGEYTKWKRTQQGVGRGAKSAFQQAMAMRIGQRLSDMARERDQKRKGDIDEAAKMLSVEGDAALRSAVAAGDLGYKEIASNKALVIVGISEAKKEATHAAFNKAHPRLSSGRGFGYRGGNQNASSAGRAAGDRVNLGRPVGNQKRGLLG